MNALIRNAPITKAPITKALMRTVGSWRAALRIAHREARRAKGRSALVLAMIGLPVLALAFTAVTFDMFRLTPAERVDRYLGTADARISWPYRSPMEQLPDGITAWPGSTSETPIIPIGPTSTGELLAQLPPGTRALPLRRGSTMMRTAAGVGSLDSVFVDATDPLTRGLVRVTAGRAPRADGETALTGPAARRLGVRPGETVTTVEGERRLTVVGLVEFPDALREVMLFPPTLESNVELTQEWLVDTPGDLSWPDIERLNRSGIVVAARAVMLHPPPAAPESVGLMSRITVPEFATGVLVAGLALLEVVLLAGPAFAVGVRMRQRQLALVAANGATPAQVRRIVLADGVVLGLGGAVTGIALGVGLAVAARPLSEEHLFAARAGGFRFFPAALAAIAAVAVVTGVLAALVPAFTTARQDVVTALAGRRGATRSRRRWVVVGLTGLVLGASLTFAGALHTSSPWLLTGIALGEFGLVLCTPALVGLVGRLGPRLPLSLRIALRDTARNRASAAPAISAVMAAVAGSVAAGLYVGSLTARDTETYRPFLPPGYVHTYVPDASDSGATPELVESVLRETLPVTQVARVSLIGCAAGAAEPFSYCQLHAVLPPGRACPYLEAMRHGLTREEQRAAAHDPRCGDPFQDERQFALADDGGALAALTGAAPSDVEAATAALRAGAVVVRKPEYIVDGKVTLVASYALKSSNANSYPLTRPAYLLTTGVVGGPIVSPALLAQLNLSPRDHLVVAATRRTPTQPEQDRLAERLSRLDLTGQVETGPLRGKDPVPWLLAGAAAMVALGAAGTATGLAAADRRPDLATLSAVGASPRLRRSLSLSQSGVIAGLGSLLGAAAGLGMAMAIVTALNQRSADMWPREPPLPAVVPWLNLAVALLVVPAIAMLGAALFTRPSSPTLPSFRRS